MLDLALINFVAAALALTCVLSLKVRPLSLAPLAVVLTHILIIQTWVLATGLIGILNIEAWRWVALTLGLALTAYLWINWQHLTSEATLWTQRSQRIAQTIGLWHCIGIEITITAMILWLATTGWLVGANIPDVVNYYLAPPTDWVADGHISTRNWRDPRAMWPQGHGLLTAWWMTTTTTLRGGMFSEIHWLLLSFTSIWALVRRLRGTPRQAAAAMILIAGIPVVWAQTVSGLNDLAISSLGIAAVACWCVGKVSLRTLAWGLLAVVIGIGVKPTMAFLAIGAGAVGLARWASAIKQSDWKWTGQNATKMSVLLLIALLVGGYWYGRNTIETSNPFYPQAVFVAGEKILEGHPYIDQSGGRFSLANMQTNLFDLFYEKAWDVHRIESGQTERGTGFGPIGGALGITALIALFLFERRARPMVLALGFMMCLVAAGVNRDVWNGRFFTFIALAGTASIVLVYAKLGPEIAKSLWSLMIASSMLFGLWYGIGLTVPGLCGSRGTVWETWRTDGVQPAPLSMTLPFHPSTYLAEAVKDVPPGATIALVYPRGIKGPAALMHGEDLSRKLIYHHDALPTPEQLFEWLKAGVGWVVIMENGSVAMSYDRTMTRMGLLPAGPSVYKMPSIEGSANDEN